MSDISVLIQGPLNDTSLECVKYYSIIGPVVICYWNTDDISILNKYNLTDCILVRYPIPHPPFVYKAETFTYQLSSIAYGLKNVDTPYVIRTRSDERYENLQPLIEKFNEDKSKIVCGNMFFRKWTSAKHHIGDHLFIGKTDILLEAYENLRQFPKKYHKNGHPEQIVAKAIMDVLLEEGVCFDNMVLFKNIFDVIDINKLVPFIASWTHGSKTYVNSYDCEGMIRTMEGL